MKLSKEDLKALKNADSVCFDLSNGNHSIHAVKERENSEDGFRQTVKMDVAGSVTSYQSDFTPTHGFVYLGSIKFDAQWQTVVSFLKENDELWLRWTADAGNGYVKDANLHYDTLHLTVKRSKQFEFHIYDSVCPDNSARMLRDRAY